jgi:putative transposase
MSHISPKSGSLGAIIRSFKSSVTRWARQNDYPDFAWQRGYFDRIIRSDKELRHIREYIRNNPLQWSLDQYHKCE